MRQQKTESFTELGALATGLRQKPEEKKYILLYAQKGTGKTRLSMAFKGPSPLHFDGDRKKRKFLRGIVLPRQAPPLRACQAGPRRSIERHAPRA